LKRLTFSNLIFQQKERKLKIKFDFILFSQQNIN
jgi:hypothetical protein